MCHKGTPVSPWSAFTEPGRQAQGLGKVCSENQDQKVRDRAGLHVSLSHHLQCTAAHRGAPLLHSHTVLVVQPAHRAHTAAQPWHCGAVRPGCTVHSAC